MTDVAYNEMDRPPACDQSFSTSFNQINPTINGNEMTDVNLDDDYTPEPKITVPDWMKFSHKGVDNTSILPMYHTSEKTSKTNFKRIAVYAGLILLGLILVFGPMAIVIGIYGRSGSNDKCQLDPSSCHIEKNDPSVSITKEENISGLKEPLQADQPSRKKRSVTADETVEETAETAASTPEDRCKKISFLYPGDVVRCYEEEEQKSKLRKERDERIAKSGKARSEKKEGRVYYNSVEEWKKARISNLNPVATSLKL